MSIDPTRRSAAGTARALVVSMLALLPAAVVATPSSGAQEPAATPTATPPGEDTGEAAPPESPPAAAGPTLQQQIEELREKLEALERAAEAAARAEAERAEPDSVVVSARDGFSLNYGEGAFMIRFRGYAQLDGRSFVGSEQGAAPDTFLLRRARPSFEGTLYERFGFRVTPDFGTNAAILQDAYIDWTFAPSAVLRAGKFKPPVGLERLQSANETAFVERALPTNLVPNRDLGVQLGGQLARGKAEYAIGVFNGVVDGGSVDLDTNDAKDLAARLWLSPWKGAKTGLAGLSFGLAGSAGQQKGGIAGTTVTSALPAYRTSGQQTFFGYRSDGTVAGSVLADGSRVRLSPQAAFYRGPLGLMAEYVQSSQEVRRDATRVELTHRAWQAQGVWILTGENASYRWYTPDRGFDPDTEDVAERGWGGLAVVARYNLFDADEDSFPTFANPASSASQAKGWAVGLDWTLQKQIRLLVDYEVTSFEGGAPSENRADEKVVFTRFQIGW